jgi:NADH-quinone oxidoreductase subunit J
MPVETILFAITAFIVIASSLMVVVNRHPVYSALYLVLTFLGLAGFYLQLSASFIAAVQVIVYAGAIMVLFTFVIMLLGEDKPLPGEAKFGMQKWLGAVFALCLLLEIGYLVARTATTSSSIAISRLPVVGSSETTNFGSVKAIGTTLFTDYIFAFEATSVVLLIAMIGIVALAKRRL